MKTATITDYDFATATLTKKIREIAAYLKMRKIIVLENYDAKGYGNMFEVPYPVLALKYLWLPGYGL